MVQKDSHVQKKSTSSPCLKSLPAACSIDHPRHRDFDQFLPNKMTDSFMTTTWQDSNTIIHPLIVALHILDMWFWPFAPFACHFWNPFRGAPSSSGACDLVSRPVPQAKGIRSRKTMKNTIVNQHELCIVVPSESTFTIFYPWPSHLLEFQGCLKLTWYKNHWNGEGVNLPRNTIWKMLWPY